MALKFRPVEGTFYDLFTRSANQLVARVRAGYLPPRLYDRAIKRVQLGWSVSLKIIDRLEDAPVWEREE